MKSGRLRAFTLLELASVLAAIAVLAALAIPSYDAFLRRTKTTEARATVEAIAHAERTHFRDHGAFVRCAPSSSSVPRGTVGDFNAAAAGWSTLPFNVDGGVRYQYEVETDAGSFVVIARGDLNGDGVLSEYRLDGRTLALTVQREFE